MTIMAERQLATTGDADYEDDYDWCARPIKEIR